VKWLNDRSDNFRQLVTKDDTRAAGMPRFCACLKMNDSQFAFITKAYGIRCNSGTSIASFYLYAETAHPNKADARVLRSGT
jgi:hypothetical protein